MPCQLLLSGRTDGKWGMEGIGPKQEEEGSRSCWREALEGRSEGHETVRFLRKECSMQRE